MAFLRQSVLILFALVLSGGQLFAASNAKEVRAWTAATAAFQAKIWSRAEMEFAQFRENFPDSSNAPQAVLLQAQSEFQQKKFTNVVALLTSNQSKAKNLEDQYVYWIGESQIADGNFPSSSDTFVSLAQNFPNSPLRVRGIVEAASALAQLKNWPQVESLLEETNGVFQHAAQMDSAGETVARGQLLLAQAKFEQENFDGAAGVLEAIHSQTLAPQLDWQRADLLCRVKIGADDLPSALMVATNLFQIANLQHDDNLIAESVALQADLLAKMNLPDDAIAAYRKNLKLNMPVKWQRQAILKITEISVAQNQLTNAGQSLADFLQQFSSSPVADMALLTLGELHLKSYAAQLPVTNDLTEVAAAQTQFDQFLGAFTNSPLIGKAFLDRGWCNWFAGKMSESLSDFQTAAQKLPPSEDLAVAKFKIADVLFAQKDFAGARTNYNAVVNDFMDFTNVIQSLGAQALYQSLRASEELKDAKGASRALARLLKQFSGNALAPNAELLYGEGLTNLDDALTTFQSFEVLWPNSDLQPQVEFAIARTYELEKNWPAAIMNYEHWLAEFPTNELLPRATYALAWANFQAGNETNAVGLFQNFVAQYSTNELAPQAQWWLGDYFYRAKEFPGAETNYERVYQDWPASDLAYPARLMAGRAAVGRGGYSDAMRYFRETFTGTNCPADVAVQAQFALGNALMSAESSITNNPLANFQFATNVFILIVQNNPTNDLGALALCYIGDCDVQLANYDAATNTYAQVFNTNSTASVSLRCRAQIGFGMALEKKAELATGDDKNALLQSALNNYFDAFETGFGKNLSANEKADPFWVKKAGLQALPLIQSLGVAPPGNFIDEMEQLLPQLKDSLEKKRAEFSQIKS